MNWASYLLSLCLHLAVFLLIMFWPSSPPVNLETPPVMISLVDGAPGGNRTPSSILGKMGKPKDGPKDVSGKILNYSILQSSGSELLDRYVRQGIRRAGKVSPPPAAVGRFVNVTLTLVR